MAMRFSEDSLQLIVGWTIQEILQMVRRPDLYSELKYTKSALKQICGELGIDYDEVIDSFRDPTEAEIENAREYRYA